MRRSPGRQCGEHDRLPSTTSRKSADHESAPAAAFVLSLNMLLVISALPSVPINAGGAAVERVVIRARIHLTSSSLERSAMTFRLAPLVCLVASCCPPRARRSPRPDRSTSRSGADPTATAPPRASRSRRRGRAELRQRWTVEIGRRLRDAAGRRQARLHDRAAQRQRDDDGARRRHRQGGVGDELRRAVQDEPGDVAVTARAPRPRRSSTTASCITLGISGIVTAFDAATGKRLWQTPAPPVDPTSARPRHRWPTATA